MWDRPKIVDLYAGVGGLSLGAARAGFDVSVAVELDGITIDTHRLNFPRSAHIRADITRLTSRDILAAAGMAKGEIAGVIGGPPCQGFSSIGHKNPKDPRNALFVDFFRAVQQLQPAFFVAENVPGILAERFKNIRHKAFKTLGKGYRILEPITVVANDYGVPTTRKRIFFIGYRPKAFTRDLQLEDFLPKQKSPIFVGEALLGLPREISAEWQDFESSCRKVGDLPNNEFYLRIHDRIPRGVGAPEAIRLLHDKSLVTGCLGTYHIPKVTRRFDRLKPGEQDPISKAVRLDPKGFCPTLRAGTGRERGSFQSLRPIHYLKPRVITPREAARLQGFPDWFLFHPTKWHSFRQIGNSVSPIVAEQIMKRLITALA